MNKTRIVTLVALTLMTVIACSSDVTNPSSGSLRVYLTDAPIDLTGVSAVNVTLTELVLFPAEDDSEDDNGGIVMDLSPITVGSEAIVNLLDYQDGAVVLIASEDVPAGGYAKLRMRISEAKLVRDDDGDPTTDEIAEEIFIPSGKVDVPAPFTIEGGETVDLVLDFDAALSVQVNETQGQNQYILRPVINLVGNGS